MKSVRGEIWWALFSSQPHRFLVTSVMCTEFLAVSSDREGPAISQLLEEPIKLYEQGPYESKFWRIELALFIDLEIIGSDFFLNNYQIWIIQWSLKSAPWLSVTFSMHPVTQLFRRYLLFISTLGPTALSTCHI